MIVKKIIAVVGATGAQGGGLVRAILADKNSEFSVRAITRNPDSENARALVALGAEVVRADIDDAASIANAFVGAHGAYCVTNFWEHYSAEREQAQAGNMAAAARACGIKHVVWSTLEDVRSSVPLSDSSMPTLEGQWKVPHFDGKGASDVLFADLPTTYLRASFYWENFIYFGMGPRRVDDGSLVLTLPMANCKLTGIAAEDVGRCAYGIFKRGPSMAGRFAGLAGEHLTGAAMAKAMGMVLGEPVRYQPLSFDAFRALGFPGAEDLGNMFQFYCDFEALVCQARPVEQSRELNPALQDFNAWLVANASRIPV